MTLVINLFGGPGVGKSTTAALLFAYLKQDGINVEIAHEYAKDLTWEERHKAIRYQPYVTTKQMWRVHRLLDSVDIVITDSPILLSLVYKGEGYTDYFGDFVVDTFKQWNTVNYLLERREYKYQPKGRRQTEEEAKQVDTKIKYLLDHIPISYTVVPDGGQAVDIIQSDIITCLQAPY